MAFLLISLCSSRLHSQNIIFKPPDPYHDVRLQADEIFEWRQGESDVIHLRGNVVIEQADVRATAGQAIIWVQMDEEGSERRKLVIYLEGEKVVVRIDRTSEALQRTGHVQNAIVDQVWLGRLFTTGRIDIGREHAKQPEAIPEIYQRAARYLEFGSSSPIQPVAFQQVADQPQSVVNPLTGEVQQIGPTNPPTVPDLNIREPTIPTESPESVIESEPLIAAPAARPPSGAANRGGGTLVDITGRDPAFDLNLKVSTNPANPNERIIVGAGGVRVTITGPDISQLDAFRTDADKQVVILADNVVAWQSPLGDGTDRWELYLEGNVIFAKDRRVIYADQMYYDANFQQGTILNADVFTPIQNFEGLVRLKASVVQQVDANNLTAYGAAFTTSRLAFPRYWLQSESLEINRTQNVLVDPDSRTASLDPNTGLPTTEDEYFVTSRRNRVYASGIPVFAWPTFRTSLNDPSLYLRRIRIGNDDVFGFQTAATFDLYQLLGIRNKPEGTEVLGSLDYLSKRGMGVGSEATYRRNSLLGIPGEVRGVYKSWFINDDGLDNLGRGRTMLVPEEDFRGRAVLRHMHRFEPGYTLRGEFGYISDRNFLESFFEREWDTEKDATTGVWLERNIGSQSYNLTADIQINDFFTQTTWLPRFDHFVLGQPLLTNRSAVHHAHSHIGYGRLRVADPPLDPAELFDPLAWESNVDGVRLGTRQQLDFPTQLGAVKVVPYVLGDLTFWQEDLNGDDALRAYGQAGVRATLPIWRSDPTIQSVLWNVNGLAHKVNFDVDAFYADASQDLERFALYDSLDDDAQEAFRRRFAFNTFGILPGGNVPLRYDERFYALRSGFQSDVTASSNEIAEDLSILRFGMRQRWQTKRGLPGDERIIDWISFDVHTSLFPNADRDNFGSDLGMLDYDFEWFIGDRVSLVSDGFADFFGQGLRTVSVGAQTSRPGVGDAYVGVRSIEGPISSNILSAAVTYRMSERWGLKANSQFDFGETGTIGNGLSFIYIGESFLYQFGVNADLSRSNVGFRFGLEPRFVRNGRLFRPGHTSIPAASSVYLE